MDANISKPEYGSTLFKNNSFNFSLLTLDTIFTKQIAHSKLMIQLLMNSSFRLLTYQIDIHIKSLVFNPQMDYLLLFMHIQCFGMFNVGVILIALEFLTTATLNNLKY